MKSPRGIFCLDQPSGYTNSATDGQRVRFKWSDIQPAELIYNWSQLDTAINLAHTNGKQIGASVAMCADPPQWLLDLGAVLYDLPVQADGDRHSMVLPWDKIVKPRLRAFITAFGKHCDGQLDYVAMGGLGCVIESYLATAPEDIGLTLEPALALWTDSCNAVVNMHAQAFKETPFIFTAAKPFPNAASAATLEAVVRAAAAKYGPRFGVMDCSLAAKSNTNYLPNKLVSDLSGTNPTGLQFLCSETGFKGHTLGGTLAQTLDSALRLKAHWIEAYPADLNKSANRALFVDASARLAT